MCPHTFLFLRESKSKSRTLKTQTHMSSSTPQSTKLAFGKFKLILLEMTGFKSIRIMNINLSFELIIIIQL